MPSVYVASRFEDKDQAREVRAALAAGGVDCTSRWLEQESKTEANEQDRRRFYAGMDLEDILSADALVLLDPKETHRTGTGGRHVETGYAIAAGRRVLILGARENVFHSLEQVTVHETVESLVAAAKEVGRPRLALMDEYQRFTRQTAKYPYLGERTLRSLLYPTLGSAGELGEYVDKLVAFAKNANAAAKPEDMGFTDGSHSTLWLVLETLERVAIACRDAEQLKRPLREGRMSLPPLRAPTDGELAALKPEGGDRKWYLSRELDELGVESSEVATSNREKLLSRKERGVLHGSGDAR